MLDAPHPRILFQNVPNSVSLDTLRALAGTSEVIGNDISGVHVSDWDLVVSFSAVPWVGHGMHLLSFGARQLPTCWEENALKTPLRGSVLNARGIEVAVDGPEISSLLERSVVANDPGPGMRKRLVNMPKGSVAFVTVGDEKAPWAACLVYPGRQFVYALPGETTLHVEWLAQTIADMHEVDPVRFPAQPDWRRSDAWATPPLQRAIRELVAIEREREIALDALSRRESATRAEIETVAADAASGMQRLLTATGDELVAAVQELLSEFGFSAENMDEHHSTTGGAKLEDLRVSFSGGDGQTWVGLVEIKGYTKGAKANDVGQIYGRPTRAYLKETGKDPDGLWHIVNVWRENDPSSRGTPFSGSSDLLLLEDNGGCAIDTRDLFRAWRDVESGKSSAEEVRQSLVSALGRWTWLSRTN
jgi:hypothetical protein